MIIYGTIRNNENGKEINGFAYDGEKLQLGNVYELLKSDITFNVNAIPLTPKGFDRLLFNLDWYLDYEDVYYSINDINPIKKYLKENYPVTYKWTFTEYNLFECMPPIEEFEDLPIIEIFNCYQDRVKRIEQLIKNKTI